VTQHEIRLRCLELAVPNGISNPDVNQIVTRAAAYFRFVVEDTGSATLNNGNAAENSTEKTLSPDTSQEPGTRRNRRRPV